MAVGVSTGGSRCSRMHVAVGGGCRDGKYGLAWDGLWGVQVAFHVATLMPREDERCTNKKRHIGNNVIDIFTAICQAELNLIIHHQTLASAA